MHVTFCCNTTLDSAESLNQGDSVASDKPTFSTNRVPDECLAIMLIIDDAQEIVTPMHCGKGR